MARHQRGSFADAVRPWLQREAWGSPSSLTTTSTASLSAPSCARLRMSTKSAVPNLPTSLTARLHPCASLLRFLPGRLPSALRLRIPVCLRASSAPLWLRFRGISTPFSLFCWCSSFAVRTLTSVRCVAPKSRQAGRVLMSRLPEERLTKSSSTTPTARPGTCWFRSARSSCLPCWL